MTKEEVVQGHTSLKAGLPKAQRPKDFIYVHCGLVRPAKKFTYTQAVKTNHKRVCISGGTSRHIYTIGQLPKIEGEEHLPWWRCREAVPKYDSWEEIHASGKVAFGKSIAKDPGLRAIP